MWYSLNRKDDQITVTNNELDIVNVDIFEYHPCDDVEKPGHEGYKIPTLPSSYINLENHVLSKTQSVSVNLKDKNRNYLVIISSKDLKEHLKIIPIAYFPDILDSIVSDANSLLCNCGCGDTCGVKEPIAISFTQAIIKSMVHYLNINQNHPRGTLLKIARCFGCDINELDYQILCSEQIGTKHFNALAAKTVLASLYMFFYLYERLSYDDVEELDEIMNYNNIRKCIIELGLNVACAEGKYDFYDSLKDNKFLGEWETEYKFND